MNNFAIAITRTCGSGGTTVGRILAQKYGISMYDRELLRLASEDSGIDESLFAKVDESVKKSLLYKVSQRLYDGKLIPPESGNFTSDLNLFNYQARILKNLIESESYVVIGRAADYILKDYPNLTTVFLYASQESCLVHEMEKYSMSEKEAARHIKKMNEYRSDYYTFHTGRTWEDCRNFDLCIDTTDIPKSDISGVISQFVEWKLKRNS